MANLSTSPWKYPYELIEVRECFYPTRTIGEPDRRREGCDKVSTWTTRGNVPHTIEATALLINAILHDEQNPLSTSNIATYSTAFARFVTGLTDVGQNKKRKLSMFDLGKGIGLPAAFIDLRHQIIHGTLPGLIVLRRNTQRAVQWLYHHYWKDIELEVPNGMGPKAEATYKAALDRGQHQPRSIASRLGDKIYTTLSPEPVSMRKKVIGKEKEAGSGCTMFEMLDSTAFVPRALGAEPIDSN